jgi:hypothetical protein
MARQWHYPVQPVVIMTATLHVYTKNLLTVAAKRGVGIYADAFPLDVVFPAGSNSGLILVTFATNYPRNSRVFAVCCSSASDVFDAAFDRPLKAASVVNGVTTQTGLLDSGPIALQYPANLSETYFYTNYQQALPGATNNPGPKFTCHAHSSATSTSVRLTSNLPTSTSGFINTVPLLSGVRSVLLCCNLGERTFDTQTLFSQSYAMCMIDLGQAYGANNGTVLTTNLQWTDNTIMRLQETGP